MTSRRTAESPVLMTSLITKRQILATKSSNFSPCSCCLQLRVPQSFSTSSTLPFSAIKNFHVSGPLNVYKKPLAAHINAQHINDFESEDYYSAAAQNTASQNRCSGNKVKWIMSFCWLFLQIKKKQVHNRQTVINQFTLVINV